MDMFVLRESSSERERERYSKIVFIYYVDKKTNDQRCARFTLEQLQQNKNKRLPMRTYILPKYAQKFVYNKLLNVISNIIKMHRTFFDVENRSLPVAVSADV